VHGTAVVSAGTAVAPTIKQVEDAIAAATASPVNLSGNAGWTVVADFLITEVGGQYVISSIRVNPSNYLNLP
jgi:hypothetical protein